MSDVTGQLAEFIAGTRLKEIPVPVVEDAKTAISDTVGVILAGASEPVGEIVTGYVRSMGGGPQATVLGANLRTTAPWAALANGALGHALDYDDQNWQLHGHASVAVLPAVLAEAEGRNASGCEVVEAFIVGFEVASKLGAGMNMAHYNRGWHATCTLGAMGATAAVCRLRGFDPERARAALGCAASHASGLRVNFGTMTKPLHAGLAAEAGVRAAGLVEAGLTAHAGALEAPLGFLDAFCGPGEWRAEEIAGNLGRPYAFEKPGNNLKPYPCCISAHAPVDALRDLMAEEGFGAGDVSSIDVGLVDVSVKNLFYHRPKTPLEGKFSAAYCLARMLLDGALHLESFTESAVNDPAAAELIGRINVRVAEEIDWRGGSTRPAIVTVHTRDGRKLTRRTDRSRGTAEWPMTEEEVRCKFRDCAGRRLGADLVGQAMETLACLETQGEIRSLLSLLA